MRTCTRCGETKPADAEHFRPRKDGACGYTSWCRECINANQRQRRAADLEGERERKRRHYVENAESIRAARRRYYREHREEAAAYAANYRAEHRERLNESARQWVADHPERARANVRNRRARLLAATGQTSAEDIAAQAERQRGRCFYCGEKIAGSYHVDHVTPLSRGGSNGPENIVVTCPTCNLSKGAKHPQDFAGILL